MSGVKGKSGVYVRKPFTKTHKENLSKAKTKQLFCSVKGCNRKHRAKGLCKKHYNKQHREENREHQVEYYENNKEHIKQYQQENKEHIAKRIKQWREDNREHIAKYNENNEEHKAEWSKQYAQTSIGKASLHVSRHNRRALDNDLTKEIIQQVYKDNIKKYGVLTCYLCGEPIVEGDKRLKDSLDHSTPLIRKGTNDFNNLGIAHLICNMKKHTMTLREWFAIEEEADEDDFVNI